MRKEKSSQGQEKKMTKGKVATLGRVLKLLYGSYPVLMPFVTFCILFSAAVSAIPAVFIQKVIAVIEEAKETGGTWETSGPVIIGYVIVLLCFYLFSIISSTLYTQLMAYITQGFLCKLRDRMFSGMQRLPVRYFDTHKHGDIMSVYTNDIDTLRQFVSQSYPQILTSAAIVTSVFVIMLYYSVWMTLAIVAGVILMIFVVRKYAGNSARFFIRQQKAMGKTEGYIQEMMNGQKVVKVFNHEEISERGFDEVNEKLYEDSRLAHRYANMLMPIMNNIGYILYAVMAVLGGVLLVYNVGNVSISGLAFTVDVFIPFLNMTRQFTGNVGQLSNQFNSIVMAMAGAERVFELMDEKPETDDGYVTLVNARVKEDGSLEETDEHTGIWAWRHPHKESGTVTYTRLEGDVQLFDVDFAYTPEKVILHNVSVYAKPGQKVAFVGATGAGKTTITNLINRFYDIADGKIRYDGININKIQKDSLRRSIGIVLQDTNLFTGSVMDNIRYGRLEATDEECIAAAKLAGADSFIHRLPEGYETMLVNNGANLSQGQRQLLAIARAAVADPPVMILDEATSSIDTQTEAVVQKGMDSLMSGRTVFVIAHRLSTVQNADVIMVLDHGRIIERGDHQTLIAQKGTYYQLYTGAFELE